MIERPIYLDHSATTPVDPRVLEVMLPYFTTHFGNTSSSGHVLGWEAEEAVQTARAQVAALLDVKPNEIVFTSGATESVSLAIMGWFENSGRKGTQIVTSKTEHSAVLETCDALSKKRVGVVSGDVKPSGLVDTPSLQLQINEKTSMLAFMHANNETGVINPIADIAKMAAQACVPLFSDITQSVGKIEVHPKKLGMQMAALSGHKMYAPKGIGALFIDSDLRTKLSPRQFGGKHENGLRSGTLNVPGIVGLGKACELLKAELERNTQSTKELRDLLETRLAQELGVSINGDSEQRLPHVSNLTFHGIEAGNLLRNFKGVCASQGSACKSNVMEPSHVLLAMGLTQEEALSSVRFSLGKDTTEDEIEKTVAIVKQAIKRMQHVAV